MPVAPRHASLFQDRKNLYQFLLFCQQQSVEKNYSQIANISIEIDPVDPLVVLQEIAEFNQPHFYFEKALQGEAIAAVGTAVSLETEGKHRFNETQYFLQTTSERIISTTAGDRPSGFPRFFCSFTFFDQPISSHSPFPAATIFLPQWEVTRQQDRCRVTANLAIHPEINLETLTDKVWSQFQTIRRSKYGVFNLSDDLRQQLNQWEVVNSDRFGATVQDALSAIHANRLNKIVLAHAIDVFSRLPFQWIRSLHNLRQLHPDCYVFSTSSGRGQNFIGASPERLISIRDRQLITDALAGSAPRGKNPNEDTDLAQRLLNSKKERHEHQVVVDFMTQRLARLGLKTHMNSAPGFLKLSNIQHLHTPIQANISGTLNPLEILAELHPTPAVAGMPRDIACHYIRRYEQFERSLYAAPLGWIDTQGNAEFIVGIRSALLEGHHARLFAGAGIVAGSDPTRETTEVNLKFQALMQALV